jgi:hypothetical protein
MSHVLDSWLRLRLKVTGIQLGKKTPSPAGEGWGEENKIKKGHCL